MKLALQSRWMILSNPRDELSWEPLNIYDSDKLEAAYLTDPLSEIPITIQNGRVEVTLSMREASTIYWETNNRRVIRGTWFYSEGDKSKFYPYPEIEADLLEGWFQTIDTDVEIPLSEDGNRYVSIKIPQPEKEKEKSTTDKNNEVPPVDSTPSTAWLMKEHSRNSKKTKVVMRSFPYLKNDFEGEHECPASHLIILVHGIGEARWSPDAMTLNTVENANNLRNDLNTARIQQFGSKERVEVLTVPWYTSIHNKELKLKLQSITLPNIDTIRSLANEVIIDVMFFMSPVHHEAILEEVIARLNNIYALFSQRNGKEFTISFLGHSLGSVILFDILQRHRSRLPFLVSNFFLIGSPISLFLTARGDQIDSEFAFDGCPNVFNIFHPYDPVSYRLEPLLDIAYSEIDPVKLPTGQSSWKFSTAEFKKLSESVLQFGSMIGSKFGGRFFGGKSEPLLITSEKDAREKAERERERVDRESVEKEKDDKLHKVPRLRLNSSGRVDYSLQVESNIASSYWTSMNSHSSYWTSSDTTLFILSQLIKSSECE